MVDLSGDDWFERLQADPEWSARNAAHEAEMEELRRRLAENQEPLVRDLRRAGFDVKTVFDLVNTKEPYPRAIPVLLTHLKRADQYDRRIREGIARALTVEEARHAVPELIAAFRRDPDTSLNGAKGALANALECLAYEPHLDEIVALALDQSHGPGRAALIEWIGRWPPDTVDSVLKKLKSDPDVDVSIRAKSALKGRYRKKPRS